jgi:hypothetical protein
MAILERNKIFLLLIVLFFNSCFKENEDIATDNSELIGVWRDSSDGYYMDYTLESDGAAYVSYDDTYDLYSGYELYLGLNWKWTVRDDSLFIGCGLLGSYEDCGRYRIISVSDSILSLSFSDSLTVDWLKLD